jgi:hypothetical protein
MRADERTRCNSHGPFIELYRERSATRTLLFELGAWKADQDTLEGTASRICSSDHSGRSSVFGLEPAAAVAAQQHAERKSRSPSRPRLIDLTVGRMRSRASFVQCSQVTISEIERNALEGTIEWFRSRPEVARVRAEYHRVGRAIEVTRHTFHLNQDIQAFEARERWGLSIEFDLQRRGNATQMLERSCGGTDDSFSASLAAFQTELINEWPRLLDSAPVVRPSVTDSFVCFSADAAAALFHEAIGHALEARISVDATVEGRIGRSIAPIWLSVIDDASQPALFGSHRKDDAGRFTGPVPLIESGILVGLLASTDDAVRLGQGAAACTRRESFRHAPSSRMSNLIVSSGTSDPESLISHPERDEFCLKVIEGWQMERGRPVGRIEPLEVVGRISRFPNCILALGSDHHTCSAYCNSAGSMVPVSYSAPTTLCGPLEIRRAAD